MLEIFLVLLVLVFVCGLCLHHHTISQRLNEASKHDVTIVRQSADKSYKAAHLDDPILAFEMATEARSEITCLQRRYGNKIASDLTNTDIQDLVNTITNQCDRIKQEMMRLRSYNVEAPAHLHPNTHPLSLNAGVMNEQDYVLQNIPLHACNKTSSE